MNIFFDLDGTLIDSCQRLYQLFQYLVPNSKLTFNEYWDLKRNKANHKEILSLKFNYSEEQYKFFEQEWMLNIEMKKWLNLDTPFEGVTDFLDELHKKRTLFLVTARQSEKRAIAQIKSFGWEGFFTKILVTCQIQEKFDLVKNTINVNKDDWFVGDTGKDIQTGKLLGIKTVAVLSGFLNKKILLQYNPDVITENVINLTFN